MPHPTPPPVPFLRRPSTWLVPAGVVGAVLAGAGTWLLTRPAPRWSAYAPLSGSAYRPSGPGQAGVVLLGAGVALLAAVVVAGLVRRRRGGR